MIKKIAIIDEYEIFEEYNGEEEYKNYWIRKENYGMMSHIIGIAMDDDIDIIEYIEKFEIIDLYNMEIERLERY